MCKFKDANLGIKMLDFDAINKIFSVKDILTY